jgi:hypothetical protein
LAAWATRINPKTLKHAVLESANTRVDLVTGSICLLWIGHARLITRSGITVIGRKRLGLIVIRVATSGATVKYILVCATIVLI